MPEDFASQGYLLWPDNWPAIQLFVRISTQWRVGGGGPIGLDYTVLYRELDRMGLAGDEYEDLFGCIRIIETTALKHFAEDAKARH